MKKILIFDFDGVLVDSIEPMLAYAGQVCQALGYPCEPAQADLEALDRMEFSEFGRQLGIPEEKIKEFVTLNFNLFTLREEPLKIFVGMDTVVKQLSRSAVLGIVTGNSCLVVNRFLEGYGLASEFHTILCAEDDGSRVDKIEAIVALNGGCGGEVYMVGDAVSDIQAARAAGVKSVAVAWGHQSRQKLAAENPDFLVETPEDLLLLLDVDKSQ